MRWLNFIRLWRRRKRGQQPEVSEPRPVCRLFRRHIGQQASNGRGPANASASCCGHIRGMVLVSHSPGRQLRPHVPPEGAVGVQGAWWQCTESVVLGESLQNACWQINEAPRSRLPASPKYTARKAQMRAIRMITWRSPVNTEPCSKSTTCPQVKTQRPPRPFAPEQRGTPAMRQSTQHPKRCSRKG